MATSSRPARTMNNPVSPEPRSVNSSVAMFVNAKAPSEVGAIGPSHFCSHVDREVPAGRRTLEHGHCVPVNRQREHRLTQRHVGDPCLEKRTKELRVPFGDGDGTDRRGQVLWKAEGRAGPRSLDGRRSSEDVLVPRRTGRRIETSPGRASSREAASSCLLSGRRRRVGSAAGHPPPFSRERTAGPAPHPVRSLGLGIPPRRG
jgi:hypothetical protein